MEIPVAERAVLRTFRKGRWICMPHLTMSTFVRRANDETSGLSDLYYRCIRKLSSILVSDFSIC